MATSEPHVVLVQPPFFRLVGSHNDRGPLELAYLATCLRRLGQRCTILNLDYTGANVHCSWRNLYERSHLLDAAILGQSSLLYESAETILGLSPTCVVLAAGDSITPWVDLGNAWVTARLSAILKADGVRVIGTGARLVGALPELRNAFDAVIAELPFIDGAHEICPSHRASERPLSLTKIMPLTDVDVANSKYDVVMTSLGCVRRCSFCDAARQQYSEIEVEVVATDILARSADHLDIGDAIFLPRTQRVLALKRALDRQTDHAITFSCELTVDMVSKGNLELLAQLGIVEVKLGVESADESAIKLMNKRHSIRDIYRACNEVRSMGLELTVYVLLGGPMPAGLEAARKTLDLCRTLPANDFVINVWAYNRPTPKPTDTHFSWHLVEEYDLQPVMEGFWQLQADTKRSIGRIIDIRNSV